MSAHPWLPPVDKTHGTHRNRITCADGFNVSVQASKYHYCAPRHSGLSEYDSFELGYPSAADDLITPYAEDSDNLTQTVYGYVPADVVSALIAKHGGAQ